MKIIEEAAKEYANKNHFRFINAVEQEVDIKAFKAGAEFAQRWISVEEELPNKFDWVLCRSELHDCYIAHYLGEYGFSVDSNSKITHWRPINLH